MADFPTCVKIGGWFYRIEAMGVQTSISAGASGDMCHMERLIRLRESLDHKRAAKSLLHEILHGVYYEWNMAQDDPQERIVSTLTDGLVAVWVDNPNVMRWIAEAMEL